jgi:hypothetical protein
LSGNVGIGIGYGERNSQSVGRLPIRWGSEVYELYVLFQRLHYRVRGSALDAANARSKVLAVGCRYNFETYCHLWLVRGVRPQADRQQNEDEE